MVCLYIHRTRGRFYNISSVHCSTAVHGLLTAAYVTEGLVYRSEDHILDVFEHRVALLPPADQHSVQGHLLLLG